METYQATGLAQYYGGTIDRKTPPKSNTKKYVKRKCKKKIKK